MTINPQPSQETSRDYRLRSWHRVTTLSAVGDTEMNGLAAAGAYSEASLKFDHRRKSGFTNVDTLASDRWLPDQTDISIRFVTATRLG
jgi:hypothetical protein